MLISQFSAKIIYTYCNKHTVFNEHLEVNQVIIKFEKKVQVDDF
jgi:hypothetical protein